MTWDDVLASSYLRDLPFKIELNRRGRIELTPRSNKQGQLCASVASELSERPGGRSSAGCSIATSDGVRVADAAWLSEDFLARFGDTTPYPSAPEICVEVMTSTDRWADMLRKAALYVEAGAHEVWIVSPEGERRVIPAQAR
jgi:Uma2 family endonuclease